MLFYYMHNLLLWACLDGSCFYSQKYRETSHCVGLKRNIYKTHQFNDFRRNSVISCITKFCWLGETGNSSIINFLLLQMQLTLYKLCASEAPFKIDFFGNPQTKLFEGNGQTWLQIQNTKFLILLEPEFSLHVLFTVMCYYKVITYLKDELFVVIFA